MPRWAIEHRKRRPFSATHL